TCQALWELPPLPSVYSVPCPSWLPQFPAEPFPRQWPRLHVTLLRFPRWRQRIGYMLRLISTPTLNDYLWLPLPVALFPLYTFLRPGRWLMLVGRQGVRMAMQRRSA